MEKDDEVLQGDGGAEGGAENCEEAIPLVIFNDEKKRKSCNVT